MYVLSRNIVAGRSVTIKGWPHRLELVISLRVRVIPTIYTTSFRQLWFTLPNLTSTQATRSFDIMECYPHKLTVCSSFMIWRSWGPIGSVPHVIYPWPLQRAQLENEETAASWKRPAAEPRRVWRVRLYPSLLLEGKFCEDCCWTIQPCSMQRTLSGGFLTGYTIGSLRILPRRRRLVELAL